MLNLVCDKSSSVEQQQSKQQPSSSKQQQGQSEAAAGSVGTGLGPGMGMDVGVGRPTYLGFINGSETFEWRSERACPLCQREYLLLERSECTMGVRTVRYISDTPCLDNSQLWIEPVITLPCAELKVGVPVFVATMALISVLPKTD